MNGDGGAIPALCNCGAMQDNIKQLRSQSQGRSGRTNDSNCGTGE